MSFRVPQALIMMPTEALVALAGSDFQGRIQPYVYETHNNRVWIPSHEKIVAYHWREFLESLARAETFLSRDPATMPKQERELWESSRARPGGDPAELRAFRQRCEKLGFSKCWEYFLSRPIVSEEEFREKAALRYEPGTDD